MATTTIYTGDTITIEGTFKDADATLIDADGQSVTFTVYRNDNKEVVDTGAATRSSLGVYTYDWLVPEDEISYILEMKGDFGTNPQLKRIKARAKFRP